jgi:RNA recognition motif-containing protein
LFISEELYDYFLTYGPIKTSKVIRNQKSNTSRGFGFVIFKHLDSVRRVMEDKEKHHIKGKWVDCKEAILRHEMAEISNPSKTVPNKQSGGLKNAMKNHQTLGKYKAQDEFDEEEEYLYNQEKGTYERRSAYNSSREAKNVVDVPKGRNGPR